MRFFCYLILTAATLQAGFGQYRDVQVKELRRQVAASPDSSLGKQYAALFTEFFSHSLFDSAKAVSAEAVKRARGQGNRKFESTAMVWEGMVEFEKGNYEQALASYIEALKIKDEIKDLKGEASLLLNMAGIYYEQNHIEKAVELYLKALEIKMKLGDKAGQSDIYINLGNVAESQNRLAEAESFYLRAESLSKEVRDSMAVAVIDRSLANIYLKQGKVDMAEQLAYSAYKYLRLKRDRHFIHSLLVLGRVHLDKGSLYKGVDYLQEAYDMAVKRSMPYFVKEASKELADGYEKLGKYDRSLFYQRQYSHISDSLQGVQVGEQLARMQVKYETEKKEKAIEHLGLENSKKELELTKRRDQVLLISALLILITAIFISFYFYSNARKQRELDRIRQERQKEIIETIITTEEKARKKIAADLHDGLGQILTAAKINLANLHEALPHEKEKLQQVTELVSSAQYESKNMALNLMPLALKENGLIESIRHICAKYNKPDVQEISFNAYQVPDKLEPVVEINTYRICQELLNNAVKYSRAAKIFLQLFCREGKLIIQIEDNGIGFDKTKTKANSLGMTTLKERVSLLKGEIEIDTAPQKGTNIFIELSLN
jgi:two-component system, NarL family, sensor kinase